MTLNLPAAQLKTVPTSGHPVSLPLTVVSSASETEPSAEKECSASARSEAKKSQTSLSSSVRQRQHLASISAAPKAASTVSAKIKGRLSSEALAKGWGIREPHLPSDIRCTRNAVRSASNANSSSSSLKADNQSRIAISKNVPSSSHHPDHAGEVNFSQGQLEGADLERLGALPLPPSPLSDPIESLHSIERIDV